MSSSFHACLPPFDLYKTLRYGTYVVRVVSPPEPASVPPALTVNSIPVECMPPPHFSLRNLTIWCVRRSGCITAGTSVCSACTYRQFRPRDCMPPPSTKPYDTRYDTRFGYHHRNQRLSPLYSPVYFTPFECMLLLSTKPYDVTPGSGLSPEPATVPPVLAPRAAEDRPRAGQQVRNTPHSHRSMMGVST